MESYGTYLIYIPMKNGSEPIPVLVDYERVNFLGSEYVATYNPVFEGTYPEVESFKDCAVTPEWLNKYSSLSFKDVLELAAQEIEPLIEKD